MFKRRFDLYAKESGEWEALPRGYSCAAAILQGFWALSSGQFLRYMAILLAGVFFAGLLTVLLPPTPLPVLFLSGIIFGYFPIKTNAWRAKLLVERGYKLVHTCAASSTSDVLKSYASVTNDI